MNPSENNTEVEFQAECQCAAARAALTTAKTMTVPEQYMVYRGIITLLPEGSDVRAIAEKATASLLTADKSQLRLFELLDHP